MGKKKEIDARGLNCPQPVILTKKALEQMKEGRLITIVNNNTAKENVKRLAENMTCSVDIEKIDGDYYINILKERALKEIDVEEAAKENGFIILVGRDTMGEGDGTLGRILLNGFLKVLPEVYPLPETIIFLNSGVNLTVEGSDVVETLKKLEEEGVEVLSCGTCLNYYHLEERLVVGEVSNMYTIVEKLANGEKVITI